MQTDLNRAADVLLALKSTRFAVRREGTPAVLDESKSLNQGALLPKDFAVDTWYWEIYKNSGLFDMDKPIAKYSAEERENLLHLDDDRKIKVGTYDITADLYGAVPLTVGGKSV